MADPSVIAGVIGLTAAGVAALIVIFVNLGLTPNFRQIANQLLDRARPYTQRIPAPPQVATPKTLPLPTTGQFLPYVDNVLKQAREYGEQEAPVNGRFMYKVADLPPLNICSAEEFLRIVASQAKRYELRYEGRSEYDMIFVRLA